MYALGENEMRIPSSYEEAVRREHPDDPISLMLIMFTMLRADNKRATFTIDDYSLYLVADNGFYSPAPILPVLPQEDCEFTYLYMFSDAYRDLPTDLETTIIQLSPQIMNIDIFSQVFNRILSGTGGWKQYLPELLSVMSVDPEEELSMISTLNRIIAKIKIQELTQSIFDEVGCSYSLS